FLFSALPLARLPLLALAEQQLLLQVGALGFVEVLEELQRVQALLRFRAADLLPDPLRDLFENLARGAAVLVSAEEVLEDLQFADAVDFQLFGGEAEAGLLDRCRRLRRLRKPLLLRQVAEQ